MSHQNQSVEKPKLVIWGASGHAMVVADIVRLHGDYEVAGFLDDVNRERKGTTFCQAPILGGREQLDRLRDQGIRFLILGFGNNAMRLSLAELVESKGYELITAVHPRTVIAAGVNIGAGTVIKAGTLIDPDCTIGRNVVISLGATLAHGSIVDDGVNINGGVNISGLVTVGRGTTIGVGAAIKDRIRIGANSLIGAGAVVVSDIPDGVVAYGVPARVIRTTTPQDY
jgi:acetyltransferase EpsM